MHGRLCRLEVMVRCLGPGSLIERRTGSPVKVSSGAKDGLHAFVIVVRCARRPLMAPAGPTGAGKRTPTDRRTAAAWIRSRASQPLPFRQMLTSPSVLWDLPEDTGA